MITIRIGVDHRSYYSGPAPQGAVILGLARWNTLTGAVAMDTDSGLYLLLRDDGVSSLPADEAARAHGYDAVFTDHLRIGDNPHRPSTSLHAAWESGFRNALYDEQQYQDACDEAELDEAIGEFYDWL